MQINSIFESRKGTQIMKKANIKKQASMTMYTQLTIALVKYINHCVGKQYRPRSDNAGCGISFESTLFVEI